MIQGHGGNIHELACRLACNVGQIVDMSSNVNPLGPPAGLLSHLRENLDVVTVLPEVDAGRITGAFAEKHGVRFRQVVSGSGTTQLIYAIPLALSVRKALILGPTYADYADACAMHGVAADFLTAREDRNFKPDLPAVDDIAGGYGLVFICNPNNPTGALVPAEDLKALCARHPDVRFIIDESYLPFAPRGEEQSMIRSDLSNVIVLSSMSKIYRVPGLRIGFMVSSEKIADKVRSYALPWSLNGLAQQAVEYLMAADSETGPFVEKTRTFLADERRKLAGRLSGFSAIRLFPSATSFVLARLHAPYNADDLCTDLAKHRILIRNCANFKGLSDSFVRFSLKTAEINDMLAERVADYLSEGRG